MDGGGTAGKDETGAGFHPRGGAGGAERAEGGREG